MLSRSHRIRSTTAAERAAKRQRREDRRALHANLALVRAGGEPVAVAVQAVDPYRLAWLRAQRCGVGVAFPAERSRCSSVIDPEHRREGIGMGQRATDQEAWSCCRIHHDERHDGRGVFATMSRADLRTFVRFQIALYLTAYTAHLASLPRATTPQPGEPVSLGGQEGAIVELLEGGRARIAWLNGTTTTEDLPRRA